MYTYQDFITEEGGVLYAVKRAIMTHQQSDIYKTAQTADKYDHQLNETIYNYVRMIWSMSGNPVEDFTASNNKIASNFFHRLNTQRVTYLLGNGITFANDEKIKDVLGDKFDTDLKSLAYFALIHGVAFGFWNVDRLYVFPLTEFAPLWDEETGVLRAGIRFWRIDSDKPMIAVLYEEDGYTTYRSTGNGYEFEEYKQKTAYKLKVASTQVDGEVIVGTENYGSLPIVPMWGSRLKQSTLVGMRNAIDSFDLIRSGFANDLSDCSQIYWILENYGGMTEGELAQFRDRLKIQHIAVADTDSGKVTPYAQEIPFQARKEYLAEIRAGIYEDFGGLDVHTVEAGATNDHIEAAYQPMDEEADDFEYQVIEFVQQVLALIGYEDTPIFKRNRISNQVEQTEMILSAASVLDQETILRKLPFITVDEVADIMKETLNEADERYVNEEEEGNE